MAKVVSTIFSQMRGSVAGTTYTANRAAAIIARPRRIPTNPNTAAQNRIRSHFSTAVQAWKSLTAAERIGWNGYAATLTIQKPSGPYTPSGREVFCGNYAAARYYDQLGLTITPGTTFPLLAGNLAIDNLNFSAPAASGVGGTVAGTNFSSEAYIAVVTPSPALDPSVEYYNGPWDISRIDEIVFSAGPTSAQVSFTDLVADAKYFFRVRCISQAAPIRMSTEFQVSGIALAAP